MASSYSSLLVADSGSYLRDTLQAARILTDADYVALVGCISKSREAEVISSVGSLTELPPYALEVVYKVAQTRRALSINRSAPAADNHVSAVDGAQIAILAIPAEAKGTLVGVLLLLESRRGSFSRAVVAGITALASALATAVALSQRIEWCAEMAELAHDLTTPVSSISGFVSLIRNREEDLASLELREYVRLIGIASDQLIHLVGDMRDMVSLAEHKLVLEYRLFDVIALVHDVASTFAPLADHSGVTIHVETVLAGYKVRGDVRRLERALGNVIQNAVKFSPPGGTVEVQIHTAPGRFVEISTSDQGPGIPEGNLDLVFQRGYRSSSHGEALGFNLGLGLTIASALVKAHGGMLFAENRSEGGARFVMRLPSLHQSGTHVRADRQTCLYERPVPEAWLPAKAS
ncbi:MAG: HAMP domain-containing histidine kinase [Chloroflexi bacterium]|nr:HAMP domain-containing histidine kinase [Chloroflexota bacterium]